MTTVYLNGEFKPLSEASVNVLDRGFIFADGVYEVIPVFERQLFCFEKHYQRLQRSLKAIHIDEPLSQGEWYSILNKLIDTVKEPNQSIYLQISRGVSERDHAISLATQATLFAMSRALFDKNLRAGIKAITNEDCRWQYCDIKAISLLPSVLLRHKAKEKGAKEAILHRDGMITEGAASNVFIVKKDTVYTPPKSHHILAGITRELIIDILKENNISLLEQPVTLTQMLSADEIWVSSSTWEIVPVIQLDGKPVGPGFVGPLWQQLDKLYQQYKTRN